MSLVKYALLALLLVANVAHAAPSTTFSRTILPEADSAFDLGTTTQAWRNLYVDSITVPSIDLTNATITNATSTNFFTSNLTIGSLSGFLKATAGVVATALIDLTADITGVLPIANGGTNASSQTTNGVTYFNGTSITSGTGLTHNGTNTGIGSTTPGTLLSVGNSGWNFVDGAATSTGQYLDLKGLNVQEYATFQANIIASSLSSALLQVDANGNAEEYAGTTCTNQFVRALSALGIATCASVDLAADVTGTLPVGNGGTGITSLGAGIATWLGTPSSANLATAVTDETGSGALVFGTSPTIGGTLTLNAGITGNVDASGFVRGTNFAATNTSGEVFGAAGGFVDINDGTDRVTFGISSGAHIGSVGARDFYLRTDATNRVTVQATTGNFGIATTTPWGKLSVKGGGTGNNVIFALGDSANSPLLTIQEDGDTVFGAGIATIGTAQYQFSAADNTNAVAFTDTGGNFRHVFGTDSNTDPYWGSFNNTDLAFRVNSVEGLRLAYNGGATPLFGVGTSTPKYRLDVDGDVILNEEGSDKFLFYDATNGRIGINTLSPNNQIVIASPDTNFSAFSLWNQVTGIGATNGTDFYTSGLNAVLYNWENAAIQFYTNNGDLALDAQANGDVQLAGGIFHVDAADSFVGIGDTTPSTKLDINGGARTATATVTDGATVTIDASLGNNHTVTLGGNRTLAFSNLVVGQKISFAVTQDGTGSRTLTYPAAVTFGSAGVPTLDTAAGSTDIITFWAATSTATIHARFAD